MKSKKLLQNFIEINLSSLPCLTMNLSNVNLIKASTLAAVLLVCVLPTAALAVDLGVQANTWEITERDMRELVLADAAKVDWSKKNDEVKESARNYTANFPKRNLPELDKTETKYLDMSIQLSSDIKIPVKGADGKYTWQVYFKKGQSFNPLTKIRPVEALLYFDARSPDQVAFAKEATKGMFSGVVPIEVSGEKFDETLKQFTRPVFYGFDVQIQRFSITALPALIYPGTGKYSLYMANTVFAKPYSVAEVRRLQPTPPLDDKTK